MSEQPVRESVAGDVRDDAEPAVPEDAVSEQAAETPPMPEVEETPAGGEPADAAESPAEDDPVEALRRQLRTQIGDWYVVHSYAGYENKVKANLESRIQRAVALFALGVLGHGIVDGLIVHESGSLEVRQWFPKTCNTPFENP